MSTKLPRPQVGDTWISLKQAAELSEVPVHTMRRRLQKIHEQQPELGLLRRIGARKFEVSLEALRRSRSTESAVPGEELQDLASRIDEVERNLLAMRRSFRSLRTLVKDALGTAPAVTGCDKT